MSLAWGSQLTMLKDGYAKIWQTIAQKNNLLVIHHADVQAVTRKNGKVQATYAVKDGDASEEEESVDIPPRRRRHREGNIQQS